MQQHLPRRLQPALVIALLLAVSGCASMQHGPGCAPPPGPQGGPPGPPPGPRHGPPMDPVFAKAFEACAAEQGRPVDRGEENADHAAAPPQLDRDAMDACLKGKGIQPPVAPPGPERRGS
ncbi:hypothetical protein [Stenotrophomonas sp.]|uniref:hypothetical protein n=1 Tax=Stenotrophomonas sp. TaxID=69392 RepID=UPI0028AD80F2|nr:hypothetical protein [Stenotrophomonas sp.]